MPQTAGARSLPRIYSTVRMNKSNQFTNIFRVRPRIVVTDSADGGELRIHWRRWTRRNAVGSGRAHPDHGSYPIRVKAWRPVRGEFTRLTVWGKLGGRWHKDPLALAYVIGSALGWINVHWMHNPASGATPWPH
ncbi:MAG TPA: hypothetical protein VE127_02495 [Solirubrobacteraceae bacterium]|nr:hypothetical protein [Solirubrobacteraceae bacterium]